MQDDTNLEQQTAAALAALEQSFRSLSGDGYALMNAFAEAEADRAARLSAAEPFLVEAVGKDDPQVRDLRLERDSSLGMAQALAATLERVGRWPRPESGQLAVYGRVVNAAGAPVQGAVVQISGPTDKEPRRIGKARTNDLGDFALLAGVCDLTVPKGQVPAWQIVVLGPKDEVIAASPVALDLSGNRITFLRIPLDAAPAAVQPGKG